MRRAIKHFLQRLFRGWDDTDTWNLDTSLAEWIVPRLKRFKKINNCCPNNLDENSWNEIIDKIIWSFTWSLCNMPFNVKSKKKYMKELGVKDSLKLYSNESKIKVKEGFQLFIEYYSNLWW